MRVLKSFKKWAATALCACLVLSSTPGFAEIGVSDAPPVERAAVPPIVSLPLELPLNDASLSENSGLVSSNLKIDRIIEENAQATSRATRAALSKTPSDAAGQAPISAFEALKTENDVPAVSVSVPAKAKPQAKAERFGNAGADSRLKSPNSSHGLAVFMSRIAAALDDDKKDDSLEIGLNGLASAFTPHENFDILPEQRFSIGRPDMVLFGVTGAFDAKSRTLYTVGGDGWELQARRIEKDGKIQEEPYQAVNIPRSVGFLGEAIDVPGISFDPQTRHLFVMVNWRRWSTGSTVPYKLQTWDVNENGYLASKPAKIKNGGDVKEIPGMTFTNSVGPIHFQGIAGRYMIRHRSGADEEKSYRQGFLSIYKLADDDSGKESEVSRFQANDGGWLRGIAWDAQTNSLLVLGESSTASHGVMVFGQPGIWLERWVVRPSDKKMPEDARNLSRIPDPNAAPSKKSDLPVGIDTENEFWGAVISRAAKGAFTTVTGLAAVSAAESADGASAIQESAFGGHAPTPIEQAKINAALSIMKDVPAWRSIYKLLMNHPPLIQTGPLEQSEAHAYGALAGDALYLDGRMVQEASPEFIALIISKEASHYEERFVQKKLFSEQSRFWMEEGEKMELFRSIAGWLEMGRPQGKDYDGYLEGPNGLVPIWVKSPHQAEAAIGLLYQNLSEKLNAPLWNLSSLNHRLTQAVMAEAPQWQEKLQEQMARFSRYYERRWISARQEWIKKNKALFPLAKSGAGVPIAGLGNPAALMNAEDPIHGFAATAQPSTPDPLIDNFMKLFPNLTSEQAQAVRQRLSGLNANGRVALEKLSNLTERLAGLSTAISFNKSATVRYTLEDAPAFPYRHSMASNTTLLNVWALLDELQKPDGERLVFGLLEHESGHDIVSQLYNIKEGDVKYYPLAQFFSETSSRSLLINAFEDPRMENWVMRHFPGTEKDFQVVYRDLIQSQADDRRSGQLPHMQYILGVIYWAKTGKIAPFATDPAAKKALEETSGHFQDIFNTLPPGFSTNPESHKAYAAETARKIKEFIWPYYEPLVEKSIEEMQKQQQGSKPQQGRQENGEGSEQNKQSDQTKEDKSGEKSEQGQPDQNKNQQKKEEQRENGEGSEQNKQSDQTKEDKSGEKSDQGQPDQNKNQQKKEEQRENGEGSGQNKQSKEKARQAVEAISKEMADKLGGTPDGQSQDDESRMSRDLTPGDGQNGNRADTASENKPQTKPGQGLDRSEKSPDLMRQILDKVEENLHAHFSDTLTDSEERLVRLNEAIERLTGILANIFYKNAEPDLRGHFEDGDEPDMDRLMDIVGGKEIDLSFWQRLIEHTKRRFKVMLALDVSGSMKTGTAEKGVLDTVALMVNACQKLGIDIAIKGFSDGIYNLKPFEKNYTPDELTDLEARIKTSGGGSTRDGEALQDAVNEMKNQDAERRIIFLVTDGAGNGAVKPADVLKEAKEHNIEVVGVGIGPGMDYVKETYAKTAYILAPSAEQLPEPMGELLIRNIWAAFDYDIDTDVHIEMGHPNAVLAKKP
ncbi:MAG: VWA domain-containing protein [Elusimicrobiota bacterium]